MGKKSVTLWQWGLDLIGLPDGIPVAIRSAPESQGLHVLAHEVLGATLVSMLATNERAFARFAAVVDQLRWSSKSLTHTAHAYANGLLRFSRLQPPRLCADAQALARARSH